MTKERIEDFRKIVCPFVKKMLIDINCDNLGEADAEMFAKDFDEILNLAIKALELESKHGYLSIDDVMSVFDDFMCREVDEDGTDTFLEMLKDRAESEDVKNA